jgi:hypothetical protein
LLSDDLIETVKFYGEVLGLDILYRDEKKVSFAAGVSVLTFLKSEKLSPVYHFAFNIVPTKIEDALVWVKARIAVLTDAEGGEIVDFSNWNTKSVYFKDNNGKIWEFIARFELPVEITDRPFDSGSIISISEMGIVAEDVSALREIITSEYNVPEFSRQKPQENFAALGDDEGLFILSKKERHWYPADIATQSFKYVIYFEQDGKNFCLSSKDE